MISKLEWRFQAAVAAFNALPVITVALVIAFVGFFSAIFAGIFGWYLFFTIAGLVVLYGVCCLVLAVALWFQKVWATWGLAFICGVYLSLFYWVHSLPDHFRDSGNQNVVYQTRAAAYINTILSLQFTLAAALDTLVMLYLVTILWRRLGWLWREGARSETEQ